MPQRPIKLSWQVKLPLLLLLFATAPLAFIAQWMLDAVQDTYEETTLEALEALAGAKALAIGQFTEDRRTEVERIAQLVAQRVSMALQAEGAGDRAGDLETADLPDLKDAEALSPAREGRPPSSGKGAGDETSPSLEAPPEDAPPPEVSEPVVRLRRQLGLILWDQQKFEELMVIAADGRVLASTFDEHESKTAEDLDYFQSALGATYVQPVFLSPITERLTMVIATPIRDESATVVGVLAARLNLSRFFRLINDAAGLGETGETLVGKRVDGHVLLMAPTRHDPNAARHRRIEFGSDAGMALQHASGGEQGSGRMQDYRDHCAFAAWHYVPALEWGLAAKIDCDEALAPVDRLRQRLLQLTLGIGGLALLAAYLAAQTLVRPLAELKDATDRISKGDFDVELRIRAGDEIGDLADSFERMLAAIKFFREGASGDEDEDALALEADDADARLDEDPATRKPPSDEEPDG